MSGSRNVEHCDVLVVGAGPAGSSAARAAAARGVKVVVAEGKPEIGVPVRCAGFIPAPLLGETGLGRDLVVQAVRGMRTVLPDSSEKETAAPGFLIDRRGFDQALAGAARRAGAEIRLSTRALAVKEGKVTLKQRGKERYVLEPKVLIGADGPHSRVARNCGLENRNLIPAVQARVVLTRPLDLTEVYFDREIYAGYGWLFPRGREAYVGLGMKSRNQGAPPLKRALNRFIARLEKQGKIKGRASGTTAGWIPAEAPRNAVKENVLLAGDAAGQTHPITGAGIFSAVTCGRMAGEAAAEAVRAGDLRLLKRYDEQWQALFGDSLERAYQRRILMEAEWDRPDLDAVIRRSWVAFREYFEPKAPKIS